MHGLRILSFLTAILACAPSPNSEPRTPDMIFSGEHSGAPVLRLGRDSFAIRFTGTPGGVAVHEYSRAGNGYRYVSRFNLGPTFHRTVEVDLDSSLSVVRARSVTQFGTKRAESDVSYTGQRAQGTVVPLQASVSGRVTIDTVLPVGAFDGLALYPVLLSRQWTVGQEVRLILFDTDELTITQQTFRVVARESVDAAGESIRALRAELSTTQLPVTLWLSEAAPHRLLKIGSANGETVLVP